MNRVDISTEHGVCPTFEFRPGQGDGPWPGVLFLMDGLAMRPTLMTMGQRLADHGYFVLMPDLFYRVGPYEPLDAHRIFTDETYRATFIAKYFTSTSKAQVAADTRHYLDHLATVPDVKPGKIGVHGYCMGGAMALTVAGSYPEQIAAAASFHGGRLATNEPDSPHRLAHKMKARVYIGVAVEDESCPPEQQALLGTTLDAAHVDYVMETYEGAKHGWTMDDTPVYHPDASEKHWHELLRLYRETL